MARSPEELRRLSRRDFLRLGVVVGAGALSSACFHQPEWQIIKFETDLLRELPKPVSPTVFPQPALTLTPLPSTEEIFPTATPVPMIEKEETPAREEFFIQDETSLVVIASRFPVFDEKDLYFPWYRWNGGQKLLEPLDIPRGTVLFVPNPNQEPPPLPEITISPEEWSVKLAERTTSLAGSSEKRLTNIRVGTEKINGAIIEPYQLFSTQDILSPFNESSGYVEGWGYLEGEEVPMIAGGVCQIPGTIFKPVIEAGMLVIERHWHEFYSDRYGEWEATVSETKDFTFRNLYDFPIQIRAKINEEAQSLTIGFWSPLPSPYNLMEIESLYNITNPDGTRDAGVRQKVIYGAFVRVREFHSHYLPKPK